MMKRRRWLPAALPMFTVFLGVSLACANTPTAKISTATPKDGAGQTPGAAPTSTPAAETYLGDANLMKGYALTALAVADPAEPGIFYKPEAGKRLFAVEIVVSNISGNRLVVNPAHSSLVDAAGYVYDLELGGVREQLALVTLDPGEQVRGWVGFTIPVDSAPSAIKYAVAPLKDEFLEAVLTTAPDGHIPVAAAVAPNTPAAKLGDVVEQFGFSLAASKVENPAAPGRFYAPKAGRRLVAVEITLANVSASDPLYVNPIACYLVDDGGFVYPVELGGRDDQIGVVELTEGEKAMGWVAFAIPDGSTPSYIKYQTHLFLGNFLITGVV